MKKHNDRCSVRFCRNESDIDVCGKQYCEQHWDELCEGEAG